MLMTQLRAPTAIDLDLLLRGERFCVLYVQSSFTRNLNAGDGLSLAAV